MEQLLSAEYIVSILLSGISLGGQLALIAIGYTMVYGILRLINFAHGDVFMVAGLLGIYISAALDTGKVCTRSAYPRSDRYFSAFSNAMFISSLW